MPVRPRYSPGGARPRAARQFTDREDLIAAFQHELTDRCPGEPRVLVFYGVGGIGKTSLRRELMRWLADKPGVVTAAVDFDTPSHQDQENALFVLRKALRDRFRASFPTFDIAYAACWQKTRPQTPLTKQTFPLFEESDMLGEVLSVVGSIPLLGALPKLPVMVLKGSRALQDWWTRRGSSELRELPGLEPAQMAERLPMFWAADLRDYLRAHDRQAVLFLDTYEALTQGERSEGRLYQRDAWVRELIAQLPEALWVVCSRERLRWEEAEPDWSGCLRQHLVGGLADADADGFLLSCGITDSTVRQAIIKGSQGLPYHLDLAVDTYYEIHERAGREPVPADFAPTPVAVLMRLLRHLTQPEVETLKLLTVPRFWNVGLFELLVREFQTGYPLTALPSLCRFSFISPGAAPGTWTMHQLMRQSLQEHTSPELVGRVNRLLLEHYCGQLREIAIRNIAEQHEVALTEAIYHGRAVLTVQELFRWFLGPAEQFERAARYGVLVPLYEQLAGDLEAELGSEHPDVAECLNDLAGLLRAQGRYSAAEPLIRRALAIREKALGPDHLSVAESLNNLALLPHARGEYAEAEALYRRALAIKEKLLGLEHPDVATSLNNLAALLYARREYAEAEPLYRRALAVREKLLGPEHSDVAEALNNLATLLLARGEPAEAEPLYRRALAIREKVLSPEHPAVATSLNNLAALLKARGRYAEAEPLHRRALAVWEKVLGPEHPNTAFALNNLAKLLEAQGRSGEAEPLYRQALAIAEKALGPCHPAVARILGNLAALCRAGGRDDEAGELERRVAAIRSGEQ